MNQSIEVYQVDSFTTTPFCGNPAGVVLQAHDLTAATRQNIARELNCSETVFVTQAMNNEYTFQYFTPSTEVDLCGHATIAGLHMLHEISQIEGALQAQTNVGTLAMRIEVDGSLWMQQAKPRFKQMSQADKECVGQALRIGSGDLDPALPFDLAYTGLWDIMVPIQSRKLLLELEPDMSSLAEISRELGAASVHVYTFDPVDASSTVHTRDFSPAVGIPEDPHTGTANGALAALLVHEGVLQSGCYTFEQGWSLNRPGHILVEVNDDMRVYVGGQAVTVFCAALRLS